MQLSLDGIKGKVWRVQTSNSMLLAEMSWLTWGQSESHELKYLFNDFWQSTVQALGGRTGHSTFPCM